MSQSRSLGEADRDDISVAGGVLPDEGGRNINREPVIKLDNTDGELKAPVGESEVLRSKTILAGSPSSTEQVGQELERDPIRNGDDNRTERELCFQHERLLREGWTPIRWRHPDRGEIELIVSDDAWIARTPRGNMACMAGQDRILRAVAEGRSKFTRDKDGNLILVPMESANGMGLAPTGADHTPGEQP